MPNRNFTIRHIHWTSKTGTQTPAFDCLMSHFTLHSAVTRSTLPFPDRLVLSCARIVRSKVYLHMIGWNDNIAKNTISKSRSSPKCNQIIRLPLVVYQYPTTVGHPPLHPSLCSPFPNMTPISETALLPFSLDTYIQTAWGTENLNDTVCGVF